MEATPFVERLEGLLNKAQEMRDDSQGQNFQIFDDIRTALVSIAETNTDIAIAFDALLDFADDIRQTLNRMNGPPQNQENLHASKVSLS